ncbi:NADP-dependent oxidoreductase [Flavicella sp.]|uniref:NADP-dependent oxidoreductase n=1 Tax=Flavicella sp. TaxID=2957742 RepID=UPI00260F56FD|nr:NADP-dependent oxidoreductase [Flavicella sp.]MDG1806205.1 NADP-dependent oxidoreductase [Flavicella sp.]
MKAIVLEKAGGVENLHVREIEKPNIKEDEVLVEVKAISINPADVKAKSSDEMLTMMFGSKRPVILGWDIAGVVSQIGNNVSDFKIGDKVFGMVNFPGVANAYAEFVASPAEHLTKIPENRSFEESAATTLAALTALQILKGNIKKGDKVLIHGGSGGVGHFGIQIAKALGAYVITTASAENKDYVLSIGADEHVDYRSQKFQEVLSNIDFVLDLFGEESIKKSIKVLKPGGTVMSTLMLQVPENVKTIAGEANVRVQGILVKSNGEDMKTLAMMLAEGSLKPTIHQVFPFEQMRKAHTTVEKGGLVGKVVVKL